MIENYETDFKTLLVKSVTFIKVGTYLGLSS